MKSWWRSSVFVLQHQGSCFQTSVHILQTCNKRAKLAADVLAFRQFHRLQNAKMTAARDFHTCSQRWSSSVIRTSDPFDASVTEVIDVRAPVEYELDHIPGSVNLPVLDDEQRAQVGELYKRDSFQARKVGASLVSSNISRHIADHFLHKPSTYRPLIYCWRGGQRSQSLALVLSQIGFEAQVLEGGYRAYRRRVAAELQQLPLDFYYVVLTGLTGTGKTVLLQHLHTNGHQVLDLEDLAKHKGSLLGLWHQCTQPSQKMFESLVRHQLASFDSAKPVWVESESSKVGRVHIPPVLFKRMCDADRVEVALPLHERVEHIMRDYPHWMDDVASLKTTIQQLKKIRGKEVVEEWLRLADEANWSRFVERLLVEHYDLSYKVSQGKNCTPGAHAVSTVNLKDLSEGSKDQFLQTVTDGSVFQGLGKRVNAQ